MGQIEEVTLPTISLHHLAALVGRANPRVGDVVEVMHMPILGQRRVESLVVGCMAVIMAPMMAIHPPADPTQEHILVMDMVLITDLDKANMIDIVETSSKLTL